MKMIINAGRRAVDLGVRHCFCRAGLPEPTCDGAATT
jgi:hypothetical protein